MEIERGTVPWEQIGRERLRRMGSENRGDRQKLSSALRATSRRKSRRHLECKEAVVFLECRKMLGRGKWKAGHGRVGGENGQVLVSCECQAADIYGGKQS